MSKLLRWLGLAVLVLVICDGIAIDYWRSIHADVSSSMIAQVLIVLPIVLVVGIFSLVRFIAYIRTKPAAPDPLSEDSNLTETVSPIKADGQWLNILATAMTTHLGSDADQIVAGLQNNPSPEPDPILRFQGFYPYLSQRINSIPPLTNREKELAGLKITPVSMAELSTLTRRAPRLEQITTQLFDQLKPTLETVSIREIGATPIAPSQKLNQATLHPAWLGQPTHSNPASTPQPYRLLPRLLVVYWLPRHLPIKDQDHLKDVLKQHFNQLGIDDRHEVIYTFIEIDREEDALHVLNNILNEHLNHDHVKNPTLLLMMGADSWIDQQLLDQKFDVVRKPVRPSEGGFAILIADQQMTTDLKPIARLTAPILYIRDQPITTKGAVNADGLIQSINGLRQKYAIATESGLVAENGMIFVDHSPLQSQNLSEIMITADHFNLEPEQFLSVSALLNDTHAMSAGFSLTLALAHSVEIELTTALINNAGEQIRLSWLVTPPLAPNIIDESEPNDSLGEV